MTTCSGCHHYIRNRLNPEAGMGLCRIGLGGWYPDQKHSCRKWEGA